MQFDLFIALDWSGAKSPREGIQVAECRPGNLAPILIGPSGSLRARWRRSDVLQWIRSKVKEKERMLIGMDFAFAYPYCDEGDYFPGHPESPGAHRALWGLVDKSCSRDKDLYGGSFYLHRDAPFADYICYQAYTGPLFDNSRLRLTEQACKTLGTRPSCTFKCVGADSVGIGTVAGMRLLHALSNESHERVPIWPFATVSEGQSAIVEIFPRLYYVRAGQDPRAWKESSCLERVLSHYKSEPLSKRVVIQIEDEADAIISAAAMRHLAQASGAWSPTSMTECAKEFEGWIFGVF